MPEQRTTSEPASTPSGHRHLTTVVLEELDEGRWRATQTGVDVVGTGDSAAEAATAYCAKISEGADAT